MSDKGLLTEPPVEWASWMDGDFGSSLGIHNLAAQSCMLSTGPPSITSGFSSAGIPSTVPWYLDSSPVLLCFFFKAMSGDRQNNINRRDHRKNRPAKKSTLSSTSVPITSPSEGDSPATLRISWFTSPFIHAMNLSTPLISSSPRTCSSMILI